MNKRTHAIKNVAFMQVRPTISWFSRMRKEASLTFLIGERRETRSEDVQQGQLLSRLLLAQIMIRRTTATGDYGRPEVFQDGIVCPGAVPRPRNKALVKAATKMVNARSFASASRR